MAKKIREEIMNLQFRESALFQKEKLVPVLHEVVPAPCVPKTAIFGTFSLIVGKLN
jgi:hypothetical protein